MAFNPEIHQVKQILIKCGAALRRAKGLPEETNITILYNEASEALGLPLIETTTADANRIPLPHEMTLPTGKFVVPRKDCPKCGKSDSVVLTSVCGKCEEFKQGYRSSWSCLSKGCDYKELSTRSYGSWLDELVPNWESGMKKDMGIQTRTDEGLK